MKGDEARLAQSSRAGRWIAWDNGIGAASFRMSNGSPMNMRGKVIEE